MSGTKIPLTSGSKLKKEALCLGIICHMIKSDEVLREPKVYAQFASRVADELYRELNPTLELVEDDDE
jgi:hypothetical protein